MKCLTLFIVLRKKRKRAARLGQSVRMQIAAIVRHKLLNARRRHLRDQVADLLIVSPGVQRFRDVPVIAFFLQLHFAGRSFEHDADNLRHDQISQFSVAEIFRLLVDRFLDRLVNEKRLFGIFEPDIHFAFERSVLAEKDFRWRVRPDQFQTYLWICESVVRKLVLVRFHFFCRNGSVLLPVLEIEKQIVHQ